MHRVASVGNTNNNNSNRPRKEKRLTYVLNDSDDTKHCAGINGLAVLKYAVSDGSDYLFTGSRDGRLKRWALSEDVATCSATFESHVDWVNDAVIVGDNTLVSCSSDTTLKTWNALSNGTCTRTLRQHSDYVTCLAAAGKNSNIVASGGLGGEVFIWDLDAALAPVSKFSDTMVDDSSNGMKGSGNLHTVGSSNNISVQTTQTEGYIPISAKGHKESVYALAMNEGGTMLVSGGTEKVVRVWDTRSGSKTLKLKGHTDNIRALLLDSTGRYCLSGSSDSMIRLWDIGQQRCVHSYAVHTDSVWALASTPTFSHVYSGGRDFSLYLTDLQTRESSLLCTGEHPIVQLALHDDSIWVASTDSSVHRWPAEGYNPQKIFQRGNSFLAGNLSFSRARVSMEGSTPVPVYKEPTLTISGTPAIVQHEVLNNKRHVLTKDTSGSVKLWEITKGAAVEDYGKVSFEEKKEELFEMVWLLLYIMNFIFRNTFYLVSIGTWFSVDTRLGSLSVHLDTPQCFYAEMYSAELNIAGKPEDDKVNLGLETLKGILTDWLIKRKQRMGSPAQANGELLSGKDIAARSLAHSRTVVDGNSENDIMVYPPFEFPVASLPSIITEGSEGGQWRKRVADLDGTEDEKDFPGWCLDCLLNNRLPSREATNFMKWEVNLGWETLKGLLAHWLIKRKQRIGSPALANSELLSGKDIAARSLAHSRIDVDGNSENDVMVYPPFEFPVVSIPSIITEGTEGGPWRKRVTDLDGTEDEKDFPGWCLDCLLNNRLPSREATKCSFYLHPCEGSTAQILTQGKLSAPRILRIHKVINYVVEKMVLDKPLDSVVDGSFSPGLAGSQLQVQAVGDGSFRSGFKSWQKLRPSIEILCNNQASYMFFSMLYYDIIYNNFLLDADSCPALQYMLIAF
ncbi:hypothetical protein TanjilG_29285 [Lupinus angustifolius]|uniref:Uncharacterized protein n=1 Tax=Lupinus angustifolius TaxID=3871 RepID=A0A1J7HL75_LUPAN|nr:hypothetical protein TanjilG_29285 [Lupinus angustifolius]